LFVIVIFLIKVASCKVALVTYLIQQPDQYITETFVTPSTDPKPSQTGPALGHHFCWALCPCIHIFNDITINFQREIQVSVFLPEYAVDLLYAFANCSGLDLIFGLNALLRTSENTWDSANAELLLKYCESREYVMSWELGNGRIWDVYFWL